MSAEVETMFSTREKPWHGLGKIVRQAPTSEEALRIAGLDWNVIREPVYSEYSDVIQGYKANVRDKDFKVLGVVTDHYANSGRSVRLFRNDRCSYSNLAVRVF